MFSDNSRRSRQHATISATMGIVSILRRRQEDPDRPYMISHVRTLSQRLSKSFKPVCTFSAGVAKIYLPVQDRLIKPSPTIADTRVVETFSIFGLMVEVVWWSKILQDFRKELIWEPRHEAFSCWHETLSAWVGYDAERLLWGGSEVGLCWTRHVGNTWKI